MSYVTGTTHYNLPQTVGTDKRDWADTNQAYADIDAAIYGAVEDVATAGTDISSLKDRMDTAEGNITQAQSDITALDGRLTTAEGSITTQAGQISDVRNDVEDMICAYNEPTATSTHAYEIGDYFIYNDVLYRATQQIAISDTIVPDTNCATTNVSSELINIINDIPDTDDLATRDMITPYKESSMIASRNYNKYDFVTVNKNLYHVTAAINSGDALVVGTNVEQVAITNAFIPNVEVITRVSYGTTDTWSSVLNNLPLPVDIDSEKYLYWIDWKIGTSINTYNMGRHRADAYQFTCISFESSENRIYLLSRINAGSNFLITHIATTGTSVEDNTNTQIGQTGEMVLYRMKKYTA